MKRPDIEVIDKQVKDAYTREEMYDIVGCVPDLTAYIRELEAAKKHCSDAYFKTAHEVEQLLGKALGYPKYAEDLKNFPEAAGTDDVCVGEHVPASIAEEAAEKIEHLKAANKRLEQETALKCAYLAWQHSLCTRNPNYQPEKTIAKHFDINLDSLYSTTWKELSK